LSTYTLFACTGTLIDNGHMVDNPLPGGFTGIFDTNTAGQIRLGGGTGTGVITNFAVIHDATNGPACYHRIRAQSQ